MVIALVVIVEVCVLMVILLCALTKSVIVAYFTGDPQTSAAPTHITVVFAETQLIAVVGIAGGNGCAPAKPNPHSHLNRPLMDTN